MTKYSKNAYNGSFDDEFWLSLIFISKITSAFFCQYNFFTKEY